MAKVTYSIQPGTHKRPNATPLSVAQGDLAAASNAAGYILFAGGSVADAYDSKLTRTLPAGLLMSRISLAAASIGEYTLFAGGNSSTGVVDAYNRSLTRSTPEHLQIERQSLAGTKIGSYALFAGGYARNETSVADAYNVSLTRTTPSSLTVARRRLTAVTVKEKYALFAGGIIDNYVRVATVDAYSTTLTRTTPTALSEIGYDIGAATVGNYALFGGRESSGTVDAYSETLVRTTPTTFSSAGKYFATSPDGYAVFVSSNNNVAYLFDKELTRTGIPPFTQFRMGAAGAALGSLSLFGGGVSGGKHLDSVEVYKDESAMNLEITIPVGCKYSFNDEVEQTVKDNPITINRMVTVGYIKYKNSIISN